MARILVVAPTPFFSDRGTHIRILEEALALEKLGHEITIATYHIGKDISRAYDTGIDVRRILRLLFWYKKLEAGPDWQKVILDLMLIRKVFFLTRVKKPDIIHGHLHEGVIIGWIAKKIFFWRNIKLVADFHGSLTGEMKSHGYLKYSGLQKIFHAVEKTINRMGDWAITSSWEATKEIGKTRPDSNIETVLDGINLDSFRLKREKNDIIKEWEISEDKIIVGYTGGLVSNKGIEFLLEAIPKVLEKRSDIFFLIGGFPAEHVEKYVKEKKLEKYVRLVSPLDYFRLPEFLSICDIAVDPKGTDTAQASGKMLNYMAAGLPIVCFDKLNNRKYLSEGGYFVSPSTADGIAQGILSLASDKEKRLKMGKINLERAQSFSWEEPAKTINNIYNNLLQIKK